MSLKKYREWKARFVPLGLEVRIIQLCGLHLNPRAAIISWVCFCQSVLFGISNNWTAASLVTESAQFFFLFFFCFSPFVLHRSGFSSSNRVHLIASLDSSLSPLSPLHRLHLLLLCHRLSICPLLNHLMQIITGLANEMQLLSLVIQIPHSMNCTFYLFAHFFFAYFWNVYFKTGQISPRLLMVSLPL